MFNQLCIKRKNIILTLLTMLLVGGIFLSAPGSTPAAHAQTDNEFHTTLFGPTYIRAGQTITYELKVENLTDTAYTNVLVWNDLPTADLIYVSGGTLLTAGDGHQYVRITLPSLAAHSEQTVSWVGEVPADTPTGTIITNNNYGIFSSSIPGATSLKFGSITTLVEAPPIASFMYKNANGTAFDTTTHGYQFQNYGAAPTNADDLSASDVYELFGPVSCMDDTSTKENCTLTGPAQQWLTNYALKFGDGGHCDGFAATSLRLFNSLPYNQYSTPSTFQPGALNTVDLIHPEQSIEHYILRYHITQNYIWSQNVTGSPNDLLDVLINDFNSAQPVGYSASIWVIEGSKWKHGHSISVIGVEQVTDSEYRILVYDSNFPKQRQYITVDSASNTWTYTTAATPGENTNVYTGTADSGNLRLIPLNVRDKPAGEYFPCPFCNGETFPASARPDGAGPETMFGEIDFQYTGEGAILVVDDEGQMVGETIETGEFVNEIPDAQIQHPAGGLSQDVPPSIVIPFEGHDETYYSVYVHGTSVDAPTHGALSMHGAGFALGVYNIELDAGEVFEFTISPDGDHISFYSTEDEVAPEIYIAHDPIHDGDPSVIFDVQDIYLLAGEKVMLDLDPELERIHFDHTGPEAENFDIDMKLIWPDGDVQDWDEIIHMPAGTESAFVDFGAWDGLLHPPIYIDDVLQNPSVNHRLKLVDAVGTYDPTPQTDAPAGVYHVEATFQNVTEVSFADAYFTVANLGLGDVLLNADAGSAGTRVSVPADALGADGLLHMNESFTFSFDVGLADTNFADLTVDANGVPHDWVHPDPEPSYDANNASFVFDGLEALPNQLGVLSADVEALLADGQISQNTALRLLQNLDRAAQLLAQGQDGHRVIRELSMFISRVETRTTLPEETKAQLVAQSEFLIDQLRIINTR